jgi:putative MFS transporter
MVGMIVETRGIETVFFMFAAVAGVGAIAATRMLETQNRRLEEIAR